MKKVLLLGIKRKLLPAYYYFKNLGYEVISIKLGNSHENDSEILENICIKETDINSVLDADIVVNFKEQYEMLQFEKMLGNTFLTDNLISFFSSKAEQDKIFKQLNIPTVPNISDNVIVKTDWSGGTGFKIKKRDQVKEGFIQDYLEIDYIISCHFYADKNKWYHLNNHIIKYIGNCPARSVTPYVLLDNDKAIIEKSIDSLSKKINIENKLFGWQFLKDQSGNLYSIDFNLRPFGGFDKGSYDTDVSDQNWISYIDGVVPPNNIKYTHSIQCIYKDMQQFGYAPWDRIKTELTNPIQFEVKEYDNILVPI